MSNAFKGQTLEFEVKKCLLIEKVPTKKVGDQEVVLQIHLTRVHNSGFFYVKEKGIGGGC